MSRCDVCGVMAELLKGDAPACCAWYMDHVVVNGESVNDCPNFLEMKDEEIQSEMDSIDRQIQALKMRHNELQRKDDANFLERAKKNIGRCFRCKDEYVKIVGVPREKWDNFHPSLNRYQYPAIFVNEKCNGYVEFGEDPPFWYCSFFSGHWGEGIVHSVGDSKSYVEITSEEFDAAFARTLQNFNKYILSIHRPNE